MAFADNLKQIPGVEGIEKLDLLDDSGKVVATLENKPGKAGSLAVYSHLLGRYQKINAAAAMEGREEPRQAPEHRPLVQGD
jgi:hypothetical protein